MQDLQTAHEEYTANRSEQAAWLQRAEEKADEFEARSNAAKDRSTKAERLLAEKEAERKAVQSELDDLLMVLGDLEDKVTKYKEHLRSLGESVSDAEEGEEEEEEEERGGDDDDHEEELD